MDIYLVTQTVCHVCTVLSLHVDPWLSLDGRCICIMFCAKLNLDQLKSAPMRLFNWPIWAGRGSLWESESVATAVKSVGVRVVGGGGGKPRIRHAWPAGGGRARGGKGAVRDTHGVQMYSSAIKRRRSVKQMWLLMSVILEEETG